MRKLSTFLAISVAWTLFSGLTQAGLPVKASGVIQFPRTSSRPSVSLPMIGRVPLGGGRHDERNRTPKPAPTFFASLEKKWGAERLLATAA